MIKTDSSNGKSLKEIRKREQVEQEAKLRDLCNQRAYEKFGEDQVKQWSNANKGLWFLPVMSEDGETIEAMAIMKPINRHILSYASTKINDDGLYAFLEQCMRECWIEGDNVILEEDDYFIPSAMTFNKILEGKKASLLKR